MKKKIHSQRSLGWKLAGLMAWGGLVCALSSSGCTGINDVAEDDAATQLGPESIGNVGAGFAATFTAPPWIDADSAPGPVELVYARAQTNRSGCPTCLVWGGVVEVDNIAFVKDIAVIYRVSDGSLAGESSASYLRTLASGRELWSFANVGGPGDTTMSVRYRVDGDTYIDNNGGAGYEGRTRTRTAIDSPLGPGRNIVVTYANVSGWSDLSLQLNANLLVRNIAPTKDVRIVYSTDRWKTVRDATATYIDGGGIGGEHWNVIKSLPYGAKELEFAAVVRQGGTESWDNNYNQNFSCRPDPRSPSAWICRGDALVSCNATSCGRYY